MNRHVTFLLPLLCCLACSGQVPPGGAVAPAPLATKAAPPRLVVLCSVDQLASWVFDAGEPFFAADGGFRRLLTQGARLSDCAYPHGCSETGPGHATIGTGVSASVHGIVRNAWWNPVLNRAQYCCEEPMPAVPGLPEGRDRGPGLLLVETFADRLRAQVAGSKIASVAWKDRSAIMMVGKSADAVVWFEATTGNLVTNTAWGPVAPAWLLRWNQQRVIDSFHGWTWSRVGPEAAYAGLVDDRPYEVAHQNGNNQRTLPQAITGGKPGPGAPFYAQVYSSPVGNEVVRLAAQACVEGLELGADAIPDLLCVSFSSTDVVGHNFGPDSVESRDALLRLDRQLADFLAHLDQKVGVGNYAIFLTADHGIGPTPEWARSQGIDAGRGLLQARARAAAEQALRVRFGAPPAGKRYIVHVGEYSFYFDHELLASVRGDLDAAAAEREACRIAAEAAIKAPNIAAAYPTYVLKEPDPSNDPIRRALAFGLRDGRAGDVQLVLKPYWLDGATPASHGTPHLYDREVVALAMGPGIAAGKTFTEPVTPGFGVVLFAKLLGIEKPVAAVDTLPPGLFTVQ